MLTFGWRGRQSGGLITVGLEPREGLEGSVGSQDRLGPASPL